MAASFFFLSSFPIAVAHSPRQLHRLATLANSDRHIPEELSQIVPADAMTIVGHLLKAIFGRKSNLLSLGFLGAMWGQRLRDIRPAADAGRSAILCKLNRRQSSRRPGSPLRRVKRESKAAKARVAPSDRNTVSASHKVEVYRVLGEHWRVDAGVGQTSSGDRSAAIATPLHRCKRCKDAPALAAVERVVLDCRYWHFNLAKD